MMENSSKLSKYAAANPLWIVFLGACPALASTTGLLPALAMGVAVMVIMLVSGLILSALRSVIPGSARVPASILVVAFIAAIVQMLMSAFLPKVSQTIGLYFAVLAVDLLIYCGSADVDGANKVGAGVKSNLLWGLSFLVILAVTGVIREFFGSAQLCGLDIPFMSNYTIPLLTKAPGGFFILAIVCAIFSSILPAKCELACDDFAVSAAGKAEEA